MYLAGYAVECLLKTKLMRMYGCRNLLDLEEHFRDRKVLAEDKTIFTHRLEDLLILTRAADRLRRDRVAWRWFGTVNRWMPAWRYTADLSSRENTQDFVESVEQIVHWIGVNI